LLIRDIQNQAFLNLLAAGANPVYGMYLDTQKLFEKALQAQHIDPAEVFKPEEEIEKIKEQQKQAAAQGPQPNPALQVAQLRAQAEMQNTQAQMQGDMQELQVRQQIAAHEGEIELAKLQMTREIEMLKMSNTQNISLETIKAKLADTAMRERSKKELFAAEQNLKLTAGSGI
jgi:DNA-directed RNA polymerase alpha subunit